MSETVFSMFEDSNGTFWMGVDGRGLYSFDKKTGRLKLVYAMEEDFTSIRCITEDSHRRLYAAVMGKGCLCYDLQTGKSRLFAYEEGGRGMANAWVTSVFCDSQDRIWFGHFGGVSCYDIRNRCFLELPFSPEIKSGSFYAFAEGEDGSIWMATRNGLLCYDVTRNQYSVMMTGQGLLDDVICGLVKDGHGDLWCSTMRGISRIDGHTKEVVNYYAGDDWQGNVYLEGRYTQATDGSIYFGSGKGIVCFHPDSIRKVRMERTPVITGMQVNGRLVNRQTLSGKHPVVSEDLVRATGVHLSYSDNSFAFWVSMMDYRNAESIFYEYRLEEFGDTWSRTLPGESRIQYHHLPPGDYTLLLRACENGFCSPVRAMKVHIAPPWYFSPFARILYTLFIIGACCLWYIAVQRKRREEVGEMKLRFFINIAHEIRSPLTLIVSPVEDLLKKASDAEMHKSLLLIRYNANRILELLNQLLDVRRIDKGQMRLHFAEIDIRHFVNELLDAFSGQARQQGITLQVEFADDLPLVWIDPDNFDKVLVNLLMNALKYTPQPGTVCVSVKTGSAPDAAGPLRDYLEIAVEDTGKGLNERELKKIFERFYQSESGRVSARQGFGIGLNLCQALVKLHYGVIFAENRKDVQGSRFVVRLPLGNKHLKKEEMADGKPEEHLSLHGRVEEPAYFPVQEKGKRNPTHYRVLVIDDDEALRNFLQESLSVHYRVDVAADGMEGWQKALATLPDVVVSDVMMPEMDGFQLLKELKKNPNTNHIPVVLLTSKTELASRMEGLEQGADGYLNKPFSQDELDVLIANLISNRLRLKGKYSGSQEQEGKVKPLKVKNTDEILMERVMTVIDQNLGNPMLSVELLAKEVGMSRTQLHRRMKDITGLAVSDFIRNIRLRQAARLLKEKRLMITQVAYAVGFSSQTHFSTMFRRQYGMTPTEYAETGEKASEDTEVTGTGLKHPDEA